jgi:hypothetical protein
MISRKLEFLSFTNNFENKSFLNEFMKLDGIKFLSLIFIFIYQIPDEFILNNNIHIMEMIDCLVEKTMDLVLYLLENIDIDYYISSFDYFFYYMDCYLTKVYFLFILYFRI